MYKQDKLPRRPAIPITLYALVAVIASERIMLRAGKGWFAGTEGVALGALCVVLIVVALAGMARAWSSAATLLVVAVALTVGCVLASLTLNSQSTFEALASKTAISSWEIRIASEPTKRDDTYRCRATMARAGSVAADVWLTLPQSVETGTTLTCVGRYSTNKDDEWGISSRMQGIWGSVRAYRITSIKPPAGLYGLLMRFRTNVLQSICADSTPQRALLAGCVCGSRKSLNELGLNDVFSRAGMSHLIAVSGSHLALFSSLVEIVLERLGVRRRLRAPLLMGLCAAYVVFCGLPPSAVRAWIMSGVAVAATMMGRRSHALSAASLAGLCMALVEPTVSGQVGFLLSVAAVCGLCLFSAYASYAIGELWGSFAAPRWLPAFVKRRARVLTYAIRESLAASVVAQVCTAPIAVATFEELSLIGPVANLLVSIPFSALVFFGLLAVATTPFPAIQAALLVPCDLCASLVVSVATACCGLPYCSVEVVGHAASVAVLTGVVLIALLAFWPHVSRKYVGVTLLLAAALVTCNAIRWRYFAPARVCVLNVGQGDSILIQEGPTSILVDAGPDDSVVAALHRCHVSHLDAVVVTHMHADHYAGLEKLSGRVACERVFVGDGATQSMPDSLSNACRDLTDCGVEEISYGDVLHAGQFELRMVWPHKEATGTQNADSVMLLVNYKDAKRSLCGLLTGDAEKDEMRSVIASGDVGNIDVLKVGHHGSDVSIAADEAAVLDPEVSVASAGKNNGYGHPSPECVNILKDEGSMFLCTKDVGDVQIFPSKDGVEVACQNANPRIE